MGRLGGEISRIKSLDSLRGIAALIVVLYHSVYTVNLGTFSTQNSWIYGLEKLLLFPAKFGESAVFLFMALSGYVLAFAYEKYQFLGFKNWVNWRFLRLLPLYYASLLVSGLICYLLFKTSLITMPQFLHYYLFSNSTIYSGPNPPLWSLTVEIILSTLFLIILRFSKLIGQRYIFFVLLYFTSYLIDGWGGRALLRSTIFFSIGISIYLGLQLTRPLKIVFLTMTSIFFVLGLFEVNFARQLMTLLQLFAIPSVLYMSLRRPLDSKFTLFIGKISFSIYVWHWPVLSVLREFQPNSYLIFPLNKLIIAAISMALVIAWATISYFLIEAPMQRFAKRFVPTKFSG